MDKRKAINLSELAYYFDAQVKDRLDSSNPSHKSRQVLALRDKLMALPDADFNKAIESIEKIVEGFYRRQQDPSKNKNKNDAKQATLLYDRVASGGAVGAVDEVSKI